MGIIAPFLAFIVIGFAAAVTITGTFFSESEHVLEARVEHAERLTEQRGTKLEVISTTYTGPQVAVVLRNVGRVPLRHFASWNVWASFHETDGTFHPERLTYTTAASPASDQWTVQGVYLDAALAKAEASQPGILDPSEEVKLLLQLSPAAVDPQANNATVGLPVGATAKLAFTWEALADGLGDVNAGGALTNDGTYVYGLRGDGTNAFWRFDVAANSWSALANAPWTLTGGGSVAYAKDAGAGYVYAFRGEDQFDFDRYSIADNNWAAMATPPVDTDDGAALAWDGVNTIYAFRGDLSTDFWAYDIPGNTWTALANAPNDLDGGGALVYVGGYVFGMRGNTSQAFWRYDPKANAWTVVADTPANVTGGGALAADGTDIYAFRGGSQNDFWKYSVARNTWTVLPNTPAIVDWGGALTVKNGTLYGFRGNNLRDFWQYTLPVYTP